MKNSSQRGISRKQATAIEVFLNDKTKSKAKALRAAGYSESMARKPHKVFDSPIVIQELSKRGYDSLGLRINPEISHYFEPEPILVPQLDFSKVTPEMLQTLKRQLEKIPDPVVVEREVPFIPNHVWSTNANGSNWPSSM